jgi:hypothetical protein
VADVDLAAALDGDAPGVGARAFVIDAGDAVHRTQYGGFACHCLDAPVALLLDAAAARRGGGCSMTAA